MGYTTDFVGHVDIRPALNDDEIDYLTAFHQSRRFDRGGGPYAVPRNPHAEEYGSYPTDRYHQVVAGQPGLWCRWVPCWDGCCLSLDGLEKIYGPTRWLRYLIDHFLRPGARAAGVDHPDLAGFTFDHHLEGMVVGCRRDTKELYAILVEDNEVRETVLRRGEQEFVGMPPLPYEQAIDRERANRGRRRRRAAEPRRAVDGGVVDLAARRAGR